MQRGTIYISRDNCRVTVVGSISEGKIKRRAGGDHEHESAKDLIQTRLIKQDRLRGALTNPNSATTRSLVTNISGDLREADLVPLMSTNKALQRKLERGKVKLTNYPKLPTTIDEMVERFPEMLKVLLLQVCLCM